MSLDETISVNQLAHVSDHAALRAEAAGRGVTIAALTGGVSTSADHASVHRALHANHNLIGAETGLPETGLAVEHLTHHEVLHKAYNQRTGGGSGTASRASNVTVTAAGVMTLGAGALIFLEDFSSGNFDQWNSCQWNAGGSTFVDQCSNYDGTSAYSAAVANGGTGHTQAARFEVRNGDIPAPAGSGERAEIGEPPADVVSGNIRRIEWDMKFESSMPVPAGGWFIPMQWHGIAAGSSPPLCLDIATDDIIYLANNDSSGYKRTAIQPVQRNVWQHWRMDVLFHANAATGWVDVWVDGVHEIVHEARATMLPGGSELNYFKIGIYRDPVNTATAILWHDNLTIVDPTAPGNSPGSATRSVAVGITAAGVLTGAGVVTFDAVGPSSAGATSTTSSTLTWTHTCGAGNAALIVGAICAEQNETGDTLAVRLDPAGANTPFVSLGTKVHSNNGTAGFIELFGLPNVSAGAHTITVTHTGSDVPQNLIGGSVSYLGAHLTAPFSAQQTTAGIGDATPGITFTGSTSGNRVHAVACNGVGSFTISQGTSRWIRNVNSSTAAGNGAAADRAAGGSVTLEWNVTADWYAVAAVEIKA